MIDDDNNEGSDKACCTSTTKKQKGRLNRNAQQLLKNAIVNRIRGDIDYANAFLLRSFRLTLCIEES
jgi:hypothetical protein